MYISVLLSVSQASVNTLWRYSQDANKHQESIRKVSSYSDFRPQSITLSPVMSRPYVTLPQTLTNTNSRGIIVSNL